MYHIPSPVSGAVTSTLTKPYADIFYGQNLPLQDALPDQDHLVQNKAAGQLGMAVHTAPAVHRISGSADGIFKIHNRCIF